MTEAKPASTTEGHDENGTPRRRRSLPRALLTATVAAASVLALIGSSGPASAAGNPGDKYQVKDGNNRCMSAVGLSVKFMACGQKLANQLWILDPARAGGADGNRLFNVGTRRYLGWDPGNLAAPLRLVPGDGRISAKLTLNTRWSIVPATRVHAAFIGAGKPSTALTEVEYGNGLSGNYPGHDYHCEWRSVDRTLLLLDSGMGVRESFVYTAKQHYDQLTSKNPQDCDIKQTQAPDAGPVNLNQVMNFIPAG